MNIVLKKIIQQLLKGFYSLNDLENPEFAEALAKVKKKHPQTSAPPKLFTKSLEVEKCTVADGVYYRANDKKNKSNKKVMFIHGGGLVEQAMPMHWIMCKDLAKDTGCEIIFPEYPLVPESNSETAHRMIVDVYKEVLKTCKPEDLTLIGDSAGGTLALSLSMIARDEGMPLANEIILISPGFSIGAVTEEESVRLNEIKKHDFIIGDFPIEKISELWGGELNSEDIRADVTKGSVKGLPHITLFSGTHDTMNIGARRFVDKMNKEGHRYIFKEKVDGIHDYVFEKSSKEEYKLIVSRICG